VSLFGQSGGVESLGAVEVLGAANGLALSEGVDVGQVHLEGDPACGSVTGEPDPREYSVPVPLGLQRLDAEIGVVIGPTFELFSDRVDTARVAESGSSRAA
jgi:hypothetical protein